MEFKTVDVETTAQAFLELLSQRGIDYFFANPGTDFAPLIDAFARFAREGRQTPRPVTVPYENAAVAMAHGYYLVTGKPQAVMVHVNVGTANGVIGIINAARDNVPMLFIAGRTPLTEVGMRGARDRYIHWGQESFDQAGMLREYVKWDYELRNMSQLETVVDRALEIAMSKPRGPVYLTLPRETIAEAQERFTMSVRPRRHFEEACHPDPDAVNQAAQMIAAAENPLIITTTAGCDPNACKPLASLAERFALPVVVFNQRHMCFPTNHPMHLGFMPDPFLETADLIMVVDSGVPWYPALKGPPEDCRIIQMGIDPAYTDYPIRSFPCDLSIKADSAAAIPMLIGALAPYRDQEKQKITERFDRVRAIHEQQRIAWREAAEKASGDSPLDPVWVSRCINEVKNDETIVFNEYDLVPTQVDYSIPGTFFGTAASGGLGWGLGASIGAKLAAPEKLVIAALGDGAYLFGNPTPCHFVQQALGAPTLTVVFNNGIYNAVRAATVGMYPDGWAAKTNTFPLCDLMPSPDYAVLVTACGGYGERVENPSEVEPSLRRALKAVKEEGRHAVLNMVCKHPGGLR
jgi:acetolactate synthase-1/2/3 large subunit